MKRPFFHLTNSKGDFVEVPRHVFFWTLALSPVILVVTVSWHLNNAKKRRWPSEAEGPAGTVERCLWWLSLRSLQIICKQLIPIYGFWYGKAEKYLESP